jgi:2-methylcitrate dehydratase
MTRRMDTVTARLVDYAASFSYADITPTARDATLRHLFDAIACAVAGSATEPAEIAVRVARSVRGDESATVWGANLNSIPAYATFANTIMVRSLDWNDGMFAKGGGHPSDMIPPLLAAGEVTGASGYQVLEAIALAYEVLGSLGNQAIGNYRGWDQGLYMTVATALGIGKLRGLDRDRMANAVSLSIVPAIPLMVTRRGALSMWKGAATAAAVMHATTATKWAEEGMTGPAEPFAGRCGIFDQISGPFELDLPAYPDGQFITEISHQKMFPAESHSQALLGFMPKVREWASVDDIESIDIDAYQRLFVAIGSDPSVWDPQNRETADHSLPYLLTVSLVDGDVTVGSFTDERIADPALRPIMAKIRITENDEYTAGYRPPGQEVAGCPRVRIVVRRKDGAVIDEEVTYPKGHQRNPMTAADLDAKLDRASGGIVSDAKREEIREAWWGFEKVPNVAEVVATLASFK